MRDRALNVWPIALGGFAGASLWISLGTMAVTDIETRLRVAALPPLWLLAAFVTVGGGAAWVARLTPARAWPLAMLILLWLPYLPGRWPGVFALWQGPIEAAVWSATLAGVAWAERSTWSARLENLAFDARRAPVIAATVAAMCYGATAIHIAERIPNGDEPHYLVIAQSLLLDHDLKIQNNHERGDYTAYFFGELRPHYLRRGIDEQIYSIHSPGLSVIVLPAFAIAGYPGAAATVIALTATASAITWSVAWLLTANAAAAWAGWAAVFLTTPFFFHGFTLYPDGVGALLVMLGVWLMTRFELRLPTGRGALLLGGFAVGVLPWLHTRFAVLAVALSLLVSLRLASAENRGARLLTFLAPPVISLAFWLGYFWLIWGLPDPSAPYGGNTQTAFGYISRGLTGLLIDQQFGVLFSAPIYVVAFAALALMMRRRARFSVELLFLVVPYVAAASSFAMWWGGVSSPARFVAAVLPVAAIPIAWWWAHQSSVGWRALTLFLLLLSVVALVPRVAVDHGALIYNDRNGFDLLLDWASQGVNLPVAFPSVHRGTGAVADSVLWGVAAIVVATFARLLGGRVRSAGQVWALLALAIGVAAMTTSSIVWARHSEPGVTPTSSQLAFLRGWNPEWQTTRVLLQPLRALSEEELARRIEVATTTRGPQNVVDAALFATSVLPAADYDVVISGANALDGELVVRVGRLDQVTERWRLQGVPTGITGLTLHLPVPVHSVVIRGDDAAKTSITKLTLRLRRLLVTADADASYALRAARYGPVRAFFMDAAAFTEPSGFWTRGQEATTVVLDADDTARAQGLPVRVRAGPVPTRVDLSVGDWSQRLTFTPDQIQEVALPPLGTQSAWALRITTAEKFS
ncbi:MAG: hypothetical protein ACRD2A_04600, partial [Vicinamibacterales bacterium]